VLEHVVVGPVKKLIMTRGGGRGRHFALPY